MTQKLVRFFFVSYKICWYLKRLFQFSTYCLLWVRFTETGNANPKTNEFLMTSKNPCNMYKYFLFLVGHFKQIISACSTLCRFIKQQNIFYQQVIPKQNIYIYIYDVIECCMQCFIHVEQKNGQEISILLLVVGCCLGITYTMWSCLKISWFIQIA